MKSQMHVHCLIAGAYLENNVKRFIYIRIIPEQLKQNTFKLFHISVTQAISVHYRCSHFIVYM